MAMPAESHVLEKTVIRKERLLALPGEVMVGAGQVVTPDTVIAKAEELPGEPYVIDLKAELRTKLTPEDVDRICLKKVGDKVSGGDTLARYTRGLLGEVMVVRCPVNGVVEFISRSSARMLIREDPRSAEPVCIVSVAKELDIWPASLRMYMRFQEGAEVKQGMALAAAPRGVNFMDYSYSPVSGIIEKVCTKTGTVTIVRPIKATVVDAYLPGVVTEVVSDRGAVVETTGAVIQGVFGIGFENYGTLRVLARHAGDEVGADRVPDNCNGLVLVAGSHISYEALRKALDGGATGVISGGADSGDLVKLIGKEIGVGITGQEDIPMTVILTEGFGGMAMADRIFGLLARADGRPVSLNGSTQVRAGVIRPEIVLADQAAAQTATEAEAEAGAEAGAGAGPANQPVALNQAYVGARVRVVAKPYFGLWGTVVALPEERRRVESEIEVRTAEVRLDDGRVVGVPDANLEIHRENGGISN